MGRVQPGLTTSSANTLPLSEGSVSLHQRRQLLYTATTGPGQGWQPPPQALRLLPPLTFPSPPLHFILAPLPGSSHLDSPLSIFPSTSWEPWPRWPRRHPQDTQQDACVPSSSLSSGCERLTFLAGSCFLLAGLNIIFLHSFLVHSFYSFQQDWL